MRCEQPDCNGKVTAYHQAEKVEHPITGDVFINPAYGLCSDHEDEMNQAIADYEASKEVADSYDIVRGGEYAIY